VLAAQAEEIFFAVAGQDDNKNEVSKAELVAAHHGDYRLFETMDIDHDETVTMEEWYRFLVDTHDRRGEKGYKWIAAVLETLHANCNSDLPVHFVDASCPNGTDEVQKKDSKRAAQVAGAMAGHSVRQKMKQMSDITDGFGATSAFVPLPLGDAHNLAHIRGDVDDSDSIDITAHMKPPRLDIDIDTPFRPLEEALEVPRSVLESQMAMSEADHVAETRHPLPSCVCTVDDDHSEAGKGEPRREGEAPRGNRVHIVTEITCPHGGGTHRDPKSHHHHDSQRIAAIIRGWATRKRTGQAFESALLFGAFGSDEEAKEAVPARLLKKMHDEHDGMNCIFDPSLPPSENSPPPMSCSMMDQGDDHGEQCSASPVRGQRESRVLPVEIKGNDTSRDINDTNGRNVDKIRQPCLNPTPKLIHPPLVPPHEGPLIKQETDLELRSEMISATSPSRSSSVGSTPRITLPTPRIDEANPVNQGAAARVRAAVEGHKVRLKTQQIHEMADQFGATTVTVSLPEEIDSVSVMESASSIESTVPSVRPTGTPLRRLPTGTPAAAAPIPSPGGPMLTSIPVSPSVLTSNEEAHKGWGPTGATPRRTPRLDTDASRTAGEEAAAAIVSAAMRGRCVRKDTTKVFEMAEMFGATQDGHPVESKLDSPLDDPTESFRSQRRREGTAVSLAQEDALAAECFADDLLEEVIKTTAKETELPALQSHLQSPDMPPPSSSEVYACKSGPVLSSNKTPAAPTKMNVVAQNDLSSYVSRVFQLRDQSKGLDREEFAQLLAETSFPFDLGTVDDVFTQGDTNGDGLIDRAEFAALMRRGGQKMMTTKTHDMPSKSLSKVKVQNDSASVLAGGLRGMAVRKHTREAFEMAAVFGALNHDEETTAKVAQFFAKHEENQEGTTDVSASDVHKELERPVKEVIPLASSSAGGTRRGPIDAEMGTAAVIQREVPTTRQDLTSSARDHLEACSTDKQEQQIAQVQAHAAAQAEAHSRQMAQMQQQIHQLVQQSTQQTQQTQQTQPTQPTQPAPDAGVPMIVPIVPSLVIQPLPQEYTDEIQANRVGVLANESRIDKLTSMIESLTDQVDAYAHLSLANELNISKQTKDQDTPSPPHSISRTAFAPSLAESSPSPSNEEDDFITETLQELETELVGARLQITEAIEEGKIQGREQSKKEVEAQYEAAHLQAYETLREEQMKHAREMGKAKAEMRKLRNELEKERKATQLGEKEESLRFNQGIETKQGNTAHIKTPGKEGEKSPSRSVTKSAKKSPEPLRGRGKEETRPTRERNEIPPRDQDAPIIKEESIKRLHEAATDRLSVLGQDDAMARLAAVEAETIRLTAEAERRKKIAAEKEAAVMRLSVREDELHRERDALKKASQDRIGAEREARKKAAVLAAQEEKMSVERERELEAQMAALLKRKNQPSGKITTAQPSFLPSGSPSLSDKATIPATSVHVANPIVTSPRGGTLSDSRLTPTTGELSPAPTGKLSSVSVSRCHDEISSPKPGGGSAAGGSSKLGPAGTFGSSRTGRDPSGSGMGRHGRSLVRRKESIERGVREASKEVANRAMSPPGPGTRRQPQTPTVKQGETAKEAQPRSPSPLEQEHGREEVEESDMQARFVAKEARKFSRETTPRDPFPPVGPSTATGELTAGEAMRLYNEFIDEDDVEMLRLMGEIQDLDTRKEAIKLRQRADQRQANPTKKKKAWVDKEMGDHSDVSPVMARAIAMLGIREEIQPEDDRGKVELSALRTEAAETQQRLARCELEGIVKEKLPKRGEGKWSRGSPLRVGDVVMLSPGIVTRKGLYGGEAGTILNFKGAYQTLASPLGVAKTEVKVSYQVERIGDKKVMGWFKADELQAMIEAPRPSPPGTGSWRIDGRSRSPERQWSPPRSKKQVIERSTWGKKGYPVNPDTWGKKGHPHPDTWDRIHGANKPEPGWK